MRIRLLLVLLCAMPGGLWGADVMEAARMPHYGQWRSSMIGGGGWIQNVVFTSDPKRLYAWVDVGGFYRSDDGGRTWRMMHGHLPNKDGQNEVRGVLVDPRKADRIVVACGSTWEPEPLGLFLSEDGGQTFTQTLKARFAGNAEFRMTGFVLARDRGNPDRLLAGSFGDGMYRSADGGKSWTLAGENTRGVDFTDVRFGQGDSSKAWACAQKLDNAIGGKPAPLAGGFFASNDGGINWQKISDESPSEIVQDPRLPRLYGIFGGGTSIRASEDGGVSWRTFEAGLQINPQKANGGFPSPYRYDAITAGGDFVVLSSVRGDSYRLPSGQTQWQAVERHGVNYRGWAIAGRPDVQPMFGQMVGSISIDPRDANHWFNTDSFAAFETTDGGKNWTLRMDGMETTVIHTLCQDPSDAGRVHMGMGDCGYFNSADGGASFGVSFMCANVKDLAVSPKLPARVYGLGTGAWEWASNQVFVSIDGGKSWGRSPMIGLPDMKQARCNTIAVNPEGAYECFLAVSGPVKQGGGGPYRSTDGGKSWQWVGEGLPGNAGLFPESIWIPGRQIAAGPGGGVACVGYGAIYRLDRASMKWKGIALPGDLASIVADPSQAGAWIVSGSSGIHRLVGDAISKVYDGKTTHLAVDLAKPGRFAAAVHEGILLSTDSGKTWKLLDEALPSRLGYNALAFAGDRVVAGSGGSGVFWIPLSASGANAVAARPVTPVPAKAEVGAAPVVRNLDFGDGEKAPSDWNGPWSGEGQVSAARDVAVQLGGKPTLRLQSNAAGASGSVRQDFVATHDEFTVSGTLRVEGKLEAVVAVQVYDVAGKQIGWNNMVVLKDAVGEKEFSTKLTLPGSAVRATLVLSMNGEGKVWFGNLRVSPSVALFR